MDKDLGLEIRKFVTKRKVIRNSILPPHANTGNKFQDEDLNSKAGLSNCQPMGPHVAHEGIISQPSTVPLHQSSYNSSQILQGPHPKSIRAYCRKPRERVTPGKARRGETCGYTGRVGGRRESCLHGTARRGGGNPVLWRQPTQ